jgi:hypothetical protein
MFAEDVVKSVAADQVTEIESGEAAAAEVAPANVGTQGGESVRANALSFPSFQCTCPPCASRETATTLSPSPGAKLVGWPRSNGGGKNALKGPTGMFSVVVSGFLYPKWATRWPALSGATQSRTGRNHWWSRHPESMSVATEDCSRAVRSSSTALVQLAKATRAMPMGPIA